MTDIEKLRTWIASYPGYDILHDFQCDFTDQVPGNGGFFPSGLLEIERKSDIMGHITVTNQYNFGLYYVFTKAPGDDEGATVNADWVMDFQRWVQTQSILHLAPTFGDVPNAERITAQNGALYTANEEGTATYMVQLSATFQRKFEVKNEWLI